ncbi:hypothetical protein [Halosimplex sp. J119]
MDELATLRAPVGRLRRLVGETAVAPGPDSARYRVARLSVTRDGLEATTPTGGDGPAFEARYDPGYFSSFDAPDGVVLAGLGTEATLRWLEWFDGGEVTVRLLGEDGLVRAIELDDGTDIVEVGPLPSDVVDHDLSAGRPSAFTDGVFAPDGEPAPTRVETDAETLARLAAAADIVGDDGLPVVVSDGEFRLSVVGEEMRGRGTLEATVSGPDCENRYGPDLAALARILSGPVELQVVPDGSVAVVADHPNATRRYVVSQSV